MSQDQPDRPAPAPSSALPTPGAGSTSADQSAADRSAADRSAADRSAADRSAADAAAPEPSPSETSTPEPSTGAHLPPLERSVVGSVGVALMGAGLRSARPLQKIVLGSLGAGLAAMAATGRNPLATALKIRQGKDGEVLVSDAVTVGKPAAGLYAVWRDLTHLPALMTHLQSVEVLDERRSRWTVKAPTGEISWEAEITADEPGRRLAWQSLPGAAVENHGEVLFRAAPGDRGTEVVVHLGYRPPAGSAGAVIARLAGEEPSQQLRDDLMRFKREQELGHAPTTEGQSSGRAAHGGNA